MQNITIYIRPIPVFHSDYINDIMMLENLTKKEKNYIKLLILLYKN